jgi:hypothetical protein
MPIHYLLPSLAFLLLILATKPVLTEWHYLAPGNGDQNVHRAFAFAKKSDDRLEFACNTKRRDLFYSTAQTLPDRDLETIKGGKPTILIRLDGVGVVPLDAAQAYQKNGRLIFVTAVTPAFITDLAKARQPVAAGIQANGKIVRQDKFPTEDLQATMRSLAAGCRF